MGLSPWHRAGMVPNGNLYQHWLNEHTTSHSHGHQVESRVKKLRCSLVSVSVYIVNSVNVPKAADIRDNTEYTMCLKWSLHISRTRREWEAKYTSHHTIAIRETRNRNNIYSVSGAVIPGTWLVAHLPIKWGPGRCFTGAWCERYFSLGQKTGKHKSNIG